MQTASHDKEGVGGGGTGVWAGPGWVSDDPLNEELKFLGGEQWLGSLRPRSAAGQPWGKSPHFLASPPSPR